MGLVDFVKSNIGICYLVALVFGALAIIIGGYAYSNNGNKQQSKDGKNDKYPLEDYFIGGTVTIFILTVLVYLVMLFSLVDFLGDKLKKFFAFFNILCAILILCAGACLISSAQIISETNECSLGKYAPDRCQNSIQKFVAGSLDLISTFMYGAVVLFTLKAQVAGQQESSEAST